MQSLFKVVRWSPIVVNSHVLQESYRTTQEEYWHTPIEMIVRSFAPSFSIYKWLCARLPAVFQSTVFQSSVFQSTFPAGNEHKSATAAAAADGGVWSAQFAVSAHGGTTTRASTTAWTSAVTFKTSTTATATTSCLELCWGSLQGVIFFFPGWGWGQKGEGLLLKVVSYVCVCVRVCVVLMCVPVCQNQLTCMCVFVLCLCVCVPVCQNQLGTAS